MPFYTIVRDFKGVADSDIDAAAVRAVICAHEYPGMRWVRSYLDRERGEMLCLYEAQNADHVREHAKRARIPAGEIREIEVVTPDRFIAAAASEPAIN
jgi:hypothetical protein